MSGVHLEAHRRICFCFHAGRKCSALLPILLLQFTACTTKPENKPPAADFTVTPESGTFATEFEFNAETSSDPEENSRYLHVRWDWEDDGTWDTRWGTFKKRKHRFTSQGTHRVALEVQDSWKATDITAKEVVVSEAPIPSFIIIPETGSVDTVFTLDASETSHPAEDNATIEVRWDWIGDGSFYTEWDTCKIVTHQWTDPGDYTVVLQARSSMEVVSETGRDITVLPHNDPPTAFFTVTPDSGSVNTQFRFDASGCSDPQDPANVLEVRWDWESDSNWDTSWSTVKQFDRVFHSSGMITVSLEVRDSSGFTDSTSREIEVTNSPPVALFSVTPTSGTTATWFQFDASASSDAEYPDQLQLRWDWEGDGIWDTDWSTSRQTGHRYSHDGIFNATLIIRDIGDQTDTAISSIQVTNDPPVADFSFSPLSGDGNTLFTFDASSSIDPESPLEDLEVRWDWKYDGIWDTDWAAEKIAHHSFQAAGIYTVVLEVRDPGLKSSIAKRQITVSNTPPTASFSVSPPVGSVSDEFIFNASSSSDPEDASADLAVRWDWENDGNWDTGWATDKVGTHQYTTAGTYTVVLEVSDTGGLSSTANREVLVSPDILWKYTPNNYGKRSSPAIGHDGTIYIGSPASSSTGRMFAITPDGQLKWSYTTGGEVLSSPAVGDDGSIYFGSADHKIYALDANGLEKWTYTTYNEVKSSPAVGADGTVYIGSLDGYVYALNPDGSLKWKYQTAGMIESSIAIGSDNTIYVGSMDHNLYALGPDGVLKWTFSIADDIYSSPAIASDGTIYIVSYKGLVFAVSPAGDWLWYTTVPAYVLSSPTIAVDGTIYIAGSNGTLTALAPNGCVLWTQDIGDTGYGSATVSSTGTIYAGGSALHVISPLGTILWKYLESTSGGGFQSSPTLSTDGILYVGSMDGGIVAIMTASSGLADSSWPKFRANIRNTGRR